MFFLLWFFCLLGSAVESTDLAFTYKHQIFILRNAERKEPQTKAYEVKYYNEDGKKGYPVGLSYDKNTNSLLVADLDDTTADIRSIRLGSDQPVKAEVLVAKYGTSAIEKVVYDSRKDFLLWNDPFKNAIYAARKSNKFKPELLENHNTRKPRGLTYDTCTRTVYWSDRSPKLPGVFNHDLSDGDRSVIASTEQGQNFQGMTYDHQTELLWYTQTTTDFAHNSTCSIHTFSGEGPSLFGMIPQCYPFTVVSDDKYLYWNDWARGGILRLEKTNPIQMAIIFKTPAYTDKKRVYHGAYGLVNLNYSIPHCAEETVDVTEESFQEEVTMAPSTEVPEYSTSDIPVPQELEASSSFDVSSYDIYKYLPLFNLGVTVFCLAAILIVCLLLVKLRISNQRLKETLAKYNKRFDPSLPATVPKTNAKPKRFGFMRPAPPCQDDGLHIDIENCCQMTLCERPCYTAITKGGKSYIGPYSKKSEDKVKLLDGSSLA